MNDNYITVTQLTRYIKYKIDNDGNLNKIYLKGEISNFKAHTRGHYYFTLKDENSRINAVMFSTYTKNVKFDIQDGMKVLVTGKVSVYEATGGYQIYVDSITEDGLGNLYVAFEQLKKKLQQEGLFDESHKKKIPKIPNRIGIITAPTGAAIKDILSTLKRRWPLCETILFPSLVQGAEAATDIVKNINIAKNYDLDVLIVGRGGGSIEDLWCFNEEIVARAIYDLDIPVISAVGHEIDFTISDFVADLRAPTPTGAAEMAVPDIRDISKLLNQLEIRTVNSISNIIKINKERLQKIDKSYVLKNPITMYEIKEQKFDNLFERLNNGFKNIININQNRLVLIDNKLQNSIESTLNKDKNDFLKILGKLEVLNPMLTIKRGYSVIRKDNKVISSINDVKKKDNLELELKDGKINVEVK
jgi:exodeoxyribonuclease VII large subunit